jgi:hypothetical protein
MPNGSLLGDLPSLTTGRLRIGNIPAPPALASARQSSSEASASAAAAAHRKGHEDAPPSFFCLINGHIMKNPVRAQHCETGGHYERETLERWIATNGWQCPLTGKPLRQADGLPVDAALAEQITSYHVRRALAQSNHADEYDLYSF